MAEQMQFGKYLLQERLASGRVADIWRAVTTTATGQQLPVVIKALRPELTEAAEVVAAFAEEARLSSLLAHPNIATVYEWGRQGRQLYLALEYIEGTNLGALLQAVAEQGVRFPPTLGIYIVSEALAALDYAHNLKDHFGNPLGLAHRDPSPPNIVISSSGQVKLVDFGLARLATQAGQTRPKILAERQGYLAPEILQGKTADARSDLYTLGVVLYEILSGRSLHDKIKTDLASSAQALASSQPPSSAYPDIPEELDRLVIKCLAEDPSARPASAGEMRAGLQDFLKRWDRQVDADSLSSFLLEVFSGRAEQKKEKVGFAFGEATSQWLARGENLEELIPLDILARAREEAPPPPADDLREPTEEVLRPAAPRFSSGETVMAIKESGLGPGRLIRNLLVLLVVVAAGAVLIYLLINLGGKESQPEQKPQEHQAQFAGALRLNLQPPDAVVFIDDQAVTPLADPPRIEGLGAGKHRVKVAAPGYRPWEGEIELQAGQPAELSRELEARKGELLLITLPRGALVFSGAKRLGKTPLRLKNLDLSQNHHFALRLGRFPPQEVNVGPSDWPESDPAQLKIERKLVPPPRRK
jgi:serine/threonine protein kinase